MANNEEKKTFNIYKLLTILLAVVLAVVLGMMLRNKIVERNAQKAYEEMAAQVNKLQGELNNSNHYMNEEPDSEPVADTQTAEDTQAEDDAQIPEEPDLIEELGIEIPEKNLDWTNLHKTNKDIYAWIYIPGTKVDYPILQHPADNSYYLNYNMNGTRGYPGCIYTELQNRKDFTDFNTIIYGHNMRNDTMFASLHDFEDEAFFNSCPYVFIYTEDKVLVYQIFTAYTADNRHILYSNDFSTDEGRMAYLRTVMKQSELGAKHREAIISTSSHIVTLSTCIKGRAQNRYLVQAVLLNEQALAE